MDYAGLFVAAFLAATILPLPSEIPLAVVVRSGNEIFWPVTVATAGNYLGACTTYALARGVIGRRPPNPDTSAGRAVTLFRRYGTATLVLSWVPIIGDAIVALAGAARVPFLPFSAWTIAGKAARYAAVAWLASRG